MGCGYPGSNATWPMIIIFIVFLLVICTLLSLFIWLVTINPKDRHKRKVIRYIFEFWAVATGSLVLSALITAPFWPHREACLFYDYFDIIVPVWLISFIIAIVYWYKKKKS